MGTDGYKKYGWGGLLDTDPLIFLQFVGEIALNSIIEIGCRVGGGSMSITQIFSAGCFSIGDTEEMARRGIYAVFRTRPAVTTHHILDLMERKDRTVLLLLDGKRTLQDVARLTRRNELEVAYVLVRLLRRGYIDFLRRPGELADN